MWLRAFQADKLRNLKSVALELQSGLTVITGRNGQGKTSLLEAVYLIATAHSFRTRKSDELIGWQGGPLRIRGEVTGIAGETILGIVMEQGLRRLFVDGVERELESFLGRLNLVALSGEAMRILRDPPDGRRRFMDSGIAGLRPSFLRDLGEYRRVLAERNALLRRGVPGRSGISNEEMEAWEERLAIAASRVHRQRREYVAGLASRLGCVERALFPEGEQVRIRYVPSPRSAADEDASRFSALFKEALARTRGRDSALGFTGVGPHRDDLDVALDDVDLRKYGSAGQLRAAMIALSAGKLGLLKDERHESPLFLMDDFDSDLDEVRTRSLMEFLRNGGYQALLATAKDGFVDRLGFPFPRIRMEGGLARAA